MSKASQLLESLNKSQISEEFAMVTDGGSIGEIESRMKQNKPYIMIRGGKHWISSLGSNKAELQAKAKRWSDTMVKYRVVPVDPASIQGDISKLS